MFDIFVFYSAELILMWKLFWLYINEVLKNYFRLVFIVSSQAQKIYWRICNLKIQIHLVSKRLESYAAKKDLFCCSQNIVIYI